MAKALLKNSKMMQRLFAKDTSSDSQAANLPQDQPQIYNAPPSYASFDQLFQQQQLPQADYSQVTDVYQRGAMPNNLMDRYNAMSGILQQQQAAMVPRTAPARPPSDPSDAFRQREMGPRNPYVDFGQLFGGGGQQQQSPESIQGRWMTPGKAGPRPNFGQQPDFAQLFGGRYGQ